MPGRIHRIHLRGGLVIAVETALAASLREGLDALFTLEDATITFRTARPVVLPKVPLLPRDFLHGRPRARDRGAGGATRGQPHEARSAAYEARAHEETPPPRSAVRPVMDDARERARRALGISGDADLSEVRRAFRRLASALHPDRLGEGSPEEQRRRAQRFAELSAAYHLLVA
ncbi:MAG: J domain-containing protein [Minicystis sp.]